jgi:hypothetical protein
VRRRGPNWSRLSRLCLLGTLVMVGWLAAPAARCTVAGMGDTEIGEAGGTEGEPGSTDVERMRQGRSFVDRFVGNVGACFAQHPLDAQAPWKERLALGLGSATLLFWFLALATRPRYPVG